MAVTPQRLLVLVLAIAGLAHASPAISLTTGSTATIALLSGATAPIQLAAINGVVTVGANATSMSTTAIAAGIVSATATNLTSLTDTTASSLRIRLSSMTLSGAGVPECVSCKLQLVCGGTTVDEIVVTNGALATASGAYQTAGASGTTCAAWYLWSSSQGTLINDKTATLTFDLDVEPAAASFPNATYYNMSVSWSV